MKDSLVGLELIIEVKACKSVGRRAEPAVGPRNLLPTKKTLSFVYKLSLRCNIQKAFGLKTNEFVL